MSLRFHEISEGNHRILNPFTQMELMLLGEICRLDPTMRQLDLASGKGEMLCQWAQKWGIRGVGVDKGSVDREVDLRRIPVDPVAVLHPVDRRDHDVGRGAAVVHSGQDVGRLVAGAEHRQGGPL